MNVGSNIIDVIIKATIAFGILLFLTRILGKKQISQLTFSHYITGITIGAIAGNIVSLPGQPPLPLLIGLVWWCFLTWLVEYVNLKTSSFRFFLYGEPAIIIRNGKFNKKLMSSSRLTINDLTMMLRQQNIFTVAEVDYAILEPNGRLSVLRKSSEQLVRKKDLNIPFTESHSLPREIIVDGNIVKRNIKNLNIDEQWIIKQLEELGIKSISEVFYAEVLNDKTLYVDK